MTPPEKEIRPELGNLEADPKSLDGLTPKDTRDIAALARRHDYALRVVTERSDGVLVTQLFTSMHPAERKVARTRERGLRAHVTLVKLTAVPFELGQSGAAG